MRTFFILLTSFAMASGAWAQAQGFEESTRIRVNFAIQKSDLRMPGLAQPIVDDIIDTANLWSTHHGYGAIHRTVLTRPDLSLEIGVGYGRERISLTRNFEGRYFGDNSFLLRLMDHYTIDQLLLPMSFRKRLIKLSDNGFIFGAVDVLTMISFRKAVLAASNVPGQRGWNPSQFEFQPYAMEFNPSLGVKFSRWEVTMAYRVYQIKKIDEVLFSRGWLDQPDRRNFPLRGYETHNPFKLWLSLSYDLGADFSLRGLLRRE